MGGLIYQHRSLLSLQTIQRVKFNVVLDLVHYLRQPNVHDSNYFQPKSRKDIYSELGKCGLGLGISIN